MRKLLWSLLIIVGWASITFGQTAQDHLSVLLPNPKLTPGVVRTTDAHEICAKSFRTGKYRHTTEATKKAVCAEYRVKNCPHQSTMELDHLVAIEDGGADVRENLWVQMAPYFHFKDALENKLHVLVCTGKISLPDAQKELSTDWIASYEKWIGPLPSK